MRPFLVLALLAVAAAQPARAAAGDKSFSADGYTIDLVGASGKLKFSVDDSNAFLMIAQDDLAEVVAATGSEVAAVPSWPSQSFSWSDDAATCNGGPGPNAAIRFCDDLTVKVGNNGAGAPTADFYAQGELTNASYYHSCACAGAGETTVPGTSAEVLAPFADHYNRTEHGYCLTCGEVCVSCTFSAGAPNTSSCAAEAKGSGDCAAGQVAVSTAAAPNVTSATQAAELCEMAAACVCVDSANSSTACPAAPADCAAGTVRVETFTFGSPAAVAGATDLDADSCAFQAEHQLRFSVEINNWPWDDAASNELSYGVVVSSSGGRDSDADADEDGSAPGNSTALTYATDDNLVLLSAKNYVRCSNGKTCGSWPDHEPPTTFCGDAGAEDCCIVRDGVRDGGIVSTQGGKDIVTYRFEESGGASGVCYDPAIGEASTDDSSAAAPASGQLAVSAALLATAIALLAGTA